MPPYQEKVEAFIEELLFPVSTEKPYKEKHRNLEDTLSETSYETEEENSQLDPSDFEVADEVSHDVAYARMIDAYPLATEYYTYPTNSKLASKQQQHVVTVNSMYDQMKAREQQLQQQLRQQMKVELQLRREQMALQLKRERMMAAEAAAAFDTRSCRTHRTHQSMSALPVRRSNYIAPKRNSYNVNNQRCNNSVANSSACDSSTDSMDSSSDGYFVESSSDKFKKLLETVVDGISSSLAPSKKKRSTKKKKNLRQLVWI